MYRKCAGFGLTELLVSFFISTLLILILTQHLLSVSRQHGQVHTTLDRAMELQWVFDVMRDRVHHAGFTPCRRLDHLVSMDTRDVPESLLPIEIKGDMRSTLCIRKMNETAPAQAHIKEDAVFMVDKSISLKSDRPVLIADCIHAEVHDVDRIEPTRGGRLVYLKKPLVFEYASSVYVGEWVSESFFLKKSFFYQQHRVDKLTSWLSSVAFEIDNHTAYPKLSMNFTSRDGVSDVLEARVRMP